jgi:hypothetical protein
VRQFHGLGSQSDALALPQLPALQIGDKGQTLNPGCVFVIIVFFLTVRPGDLG